VSKAVTFFRSSGKSRQHMIACGQAVHVQMQPLPNEQLSLTLTLTLFKCERRCFKEMPSLESDYNSFLGFLVFLVFFTLLFFRWRPLPRVTHHNAEQHNEASETVAYLPGTRSLFPIKSESLLRSASPKLYKPPMFRCQQPQQRSPHRIHQTSLNLSALRLKLTIPRQQTLRGVDFLRNG
jgi:hypothetical protein